MGPLPAWQAWIIVQHPYKNAAIAANDKFTIYPAVVILLKKLCSCVNPD
jgi:hypothetical protein